MGGIPSVEIRARFPKMTVKVIEVIIGWIKNQMGPKIVCL